MLTPHSLTYEEECEPNREYTSETLHNMLIRNYQFESDAPKLPDNFTINYRGHQKIISNLLSRAPSMINAFGQMGVTPLDIVTNPIQFKHLFRDCNELKTINCLTTTSENVPLVTFAATTCDMFASDRYPVTVNFDFTELQLLFEKTVRLKNLWVKLVGIAGHKQLLLNFFEAKNIIFRECEWSKKYSKSGDRKIDRCKITKMLKYSVISQIFRLPMPDITHRYF